MEVTEKRHIKSGKEYDHLLPKANGEKTIIKRHAKLEDTVKFLPEAINKTLYQTEKIAPELIGETPYETCRNIWQFIFDHIEYRKDESGKEQIQSPQYTWAVRKGDCDDYTVMIVSIISHIEGLKPILRIAAYNETTGYQHIYPVAILPTGEEVTMDCVAKKFDYEVPYIYKQDKKMELQFLNGLEGTRTGSSKLGIDADDLLDGYEDVGDLGKIKLFKSKASGGGGGGVKSKLKNVVKKVQNSKIAQTVRKGLHLTNKINPAAALLRTGILIALKTNLFKIAERLRFSYLTPQQVTERGMDMDKYNRLIGVRDQLEKIFFRAGGELKNFKKEILTGKGNRDKQIPLSGLGALDFNNYNQYHTPLQVLGLDTYSSEMSGVEGLGELGEAFTAGAAVTAATGALTAIAALLKSIGDLKKKPSNASTERTAVTEQSEETPQTPTESPITETPISTSDSGMNSFFKDRAETSGASKSNGSGVENKSSNADTPATTSKSEDKTTSDTSSSADNSSSTGEQTDTTDTGGGNENSDSAKGTSNNTSSTTAREKEGFLTKAGNWIKANPIPTTVGVIVVVGGIFALVKYFGKDKDEKKHGKAQLAGLPHSKNKKAYYKGKVRTYRLK